MHKSKIIQYLSATLLAALLGGFQASAAAAQGGRSLGAGFMAGMTPEQACANYKRKFKSAFESNYICRLAGKRDFRNLTVVNGDIEYTSVKGRPVQAVALYFDEASKLSRVVSVLEPRFGIRVEID